MTDADRTPMQATEQAEGTQAEPANTQEQLVGEQEQGEEQGLLTKLASATKNAASAVTETTLEKTSAVIERVTSDEGDRTEATTPEQAATAVSNEQPAAEQEASLVKPAGDLAQSAAATAGDVAQVTADQVKRVGARIYDRLIPQGDVAQVTADQVKRIGARIYDRVVPRAEMREQPAEAPAGATFEPTEETAKSGRPRRFKDVQPGMQLEGKVTSIALYGIFVDVGVGRDGLVHISEMSDTRIESPTELVQIGDPVTVWVKSVDPEAWRISLTMRDPNRPKPQRERRGPRKPELDRAKLAELKPGDTVSGTVRSLAPFGAFVDIGVGKDGLVHISELSEERIERPEEAVQVGEHYTFKILEIDPEGNRISLSLRRALRAIRLQQLEPGMVLEGAVSGMAPFGAFIDIGVGRDGLVHISELSRDRVNSVEEVIKVGDKVQVKVIEVDQNSKRISLTMRVDEPLPHERERPAPRTVEPAEPVIVSGSRPSSDEEEEGRGRGRGRKEQRGRRERRGSEGGRRGAHAGRGRQAVQQPYEAEDVYTYQEPDEEEAFSGNATLDDLVSKFNADKGRRKSRRDEAYEEEDEEREQGKGRRDAIRRTLALLDEE